MFYTGGTGQTRQLSTLTSQNRGYAEELLFETSDTCKEWQDELHYPMCKTESSAKTSLRYQSL